MIALTHPCAASLNALIKGFAHESLAVDMQVTGLTSNSVSVKPGDLFIAQAGLTRHAIDFAADAVRAGAIAVLYDVDDAYSLQRIALLRKQVETCWVGVPALSTVTGEIASRFYDHPSRHFKLIGVTGTDGKTSVTHLLVQALTRLGKVAGSVGTLGYGLPQQLKMTAYTTPDAVTLQTILFELQQKHCEYVVMEVSSHALEQFRVSGCEFDIAVLTNLGSDHLDYHGDQSEYAASKARLFKRPELSALVLNVNDAFGRELAMRHASRLVAGYSSTPITENGLTHRIQLVESQMTARGLKISASLDGEMIHIQSGLVGAFNNDNLLACISVLNQLGFGRDQIEHAMQHVQTIPGRMEYYPATRQHPAVVIDFAHTAQALQACLSSVQGQFQGRLICVFGCGGDRDQSKRPKMARVAEQLADEVIVTDDNPRFESPERIIQDILSGFEQPQRVRVIHDRRSAIEAAIREARTEDLVVIAGKGHEQFQIVGDQRLPFSDRHVVREILGVVDD